MNRETKRARDTDRQSDKRTEHNIYSIGFILCIIYIALHDRLIKKEKIETDRHIDRQTDRKTDRQTDRQTNKKTDRQTKQTDRQTDRRTKGDRRSGYSNVHCPSQFLQNTRNTLVYPVGLYILHCLHKYGDRES